MEGRLNEGLSPDGYCGETFVATPLLAFARVVRLSARLERGRGLIGPHVLSEAGVLRQTADEDAAHVGDGEVDGHGASARVGHVLRLLWCALSGGVFYGRARNSRTM